VVQNEGADHTFPSVNVGLVYLQNATRGGGALWVLEVCETLPPHVRCIISHPPRPTVCV